MARWWFLWLPNRCHTLHIGHACEQTAVLACNKDTAASFSKSKRHVRDIFTYTFSTDSKPKWRVLVLFKIGGIEEKSASKLHAISKVIQFKSLCDHKKPQMKHLCHTLTLLHVWANHQQTDRQNVIRTESFPIKDFALLSPFPPPFSPSLSITPSHSIVLAMTFRRKS